MQLRTAYDELLEMGMEAFAERARRELLATGETVRRRRDESRDELTPQEWQIASLAREGLSNPEIGERLFLSPRTVEWHLKKVFTKLGIKSRMGPARRPCRPAAGTRSAHRSCRCRRFDLSDWATTTRRWRPRRGRTRACTGAMCCRAHGRFQ